MSDAEKQLTSILDTLNQLAADLDLAVVNIRRTLKGSAKPQANKPQPTINAPPKPSTPGADSPLNHFQENLANMLNCEDKGAYWRISPKQFLGSENFAQIAAVVRTMGGEYVSAGKESHFRLPK